MGEEQRAAEGVCRVCGAAGPRAAGLLDVGLGPPIQIRDCPSCGCRFAPYDSSVYDELHRRDASYRALDRLAGRVRELFDRGDAAGLRRLLVRSRPSWRFIIESIEARPQPAAILEIGCARGVVGAYFILTRHDYLGVDVSQTAIESATARFGPHFQVAENLAGVDSAGFDVAFHSGTIGCVEDPIGLTRETLNLLRPGGLLLFNAPSAEESRELGALWRPTTKPPDVVTLFPVDFWRRTFPDCAVDCAVSSLSRTQSRARRLRVRRSGPPDPDRVVTGRVHELPTASLGRAVSWGAEMAAGRVFAASPRIDAAAARLLGDDGAHEPFPLSFGVHVTMEPGGGDHPGGSGRS